MSRAHQIACLSALALLLSGVAGCGHSAANTTSDSAPVVSAPPGETPGPSGKMRGGATISTKAYPAPPGVETGNFAGGRK